MYARYLVPILMFVFAACHEGSRQVAPAQARLAATRAKAVSCESNIPARQVTSASAAATATKNTPAPPGSPDRLSPGPLSPSSLKISPRPGVTDPPSGSHTGMIWISGGTFRMGADNDQAQPDEYPKHTVTINGFWMDS